MKPTYALVTGASAGIGYGIAEELVSNGLGLFLLGHFADEVATSAARPRILAGNDHVSTIILDARVATPEEIRAAIENTITNRELQLSSLVNNVGSNLISHPFRTLAVRSRTRDSERALLVYCAWGCEESRDFVMGSEGVSRLQHLWKANIELG